MRKSTIHNPQSAIESHFTFHVSLLGALLLLLIVSAPPVSGHPLGNFSVNRYSRLELSAENIRIHYVLDMAEIPTFQERAVIDTDGDGTISAQEHAHYLTAKAGELGRALHLTINSSPVPLKLVSHDLNFPPGQGGLLTLRLSCLMETSLPPLSPPVHGGNKGGGVWQVDYRDDNYSNRLGWKEIIARSLPGVALRESTVPQQDESDELRHYPDDMLSSPLDVREARLTFAPGAGGPVASHSAARGQGVLGRAGDSFAALISSETLSLSVILISLLVALGLGGLHALSPGHGKTVVGAYLVGARGTAMHALFLGLTVTLTHTAGVFVLGLITLYASRYILPEQLYPWLGAASGLIVVGIGVVLLLQRLRRFLNLSHHSHDEHVHHEHSHLPLGADGSPVTWRSLLALGVSGGLLPCPSALVVLLSAIALHRVSFGLLLIVAFSAGLAGVLTGIGLIFVYARRFFERFRMNSPAMQFLPVLSALVIMLLGMGITAQGLVQSGWLNVYAFLDNLRQTTMASVIGLGFVLGLKHALEADHIVAVSTIVSERRRVGSASLVGIFWGLGHTASLLVAGLVVMALRTQIPERIALGMEFGVAMMLMILGGNTLRKLLTGVKFHLHQHTHEGHTHFHPHFHEVERLEVLHHAPHSHHPVGIGIKPFLVGMVHGMAGSAVLMLLVLTTIPSRLLGLLYIGIFGIGSLGGMLLMSLLISIPFILTAQRFERLNTALQAFAGLLSIGVGLFLIWPK